MDPHQPFPEDVEMGENLGFMRKCMRRVQDAPEGESCFDSFIEEIFEEVDLLDAWRHGESPTAEGHQKDDQRQQTAKGYGQSHAFALDFFDNLIEQDMCLYPWIICSGAGRCKKFGEELCKNWNTHKEAALMMKLAPKVKLCTDGLHTLIEQSDRKKLFSKVKDALRKDKREKVKKANTLRTYMEHKPRDKSGYFCRDGYDSFKHFMTFAEEFISQVLCNTKGSIPAATAQPQALLMIYHGIYIQAFLFGLCARLHFPEVELRKIWEQPLFEGDWIEIDRKHKTVTIKESSLEERYRAVFQKRTRSLPFEEIEVAFGGQSLDVTGHDMEWYSHDASSE